MADAEQYRDWASQQVDTRIRNRMLDEADRIDRREATPQIHIGINITINRKGES